MIGGQDKIYSTSINKLSKTVKQNRVKWLGRINDAELRQYYMHALCFVYPSLYEGFGIPPLEAMACGTPTVVSDIPSVREVCQNASLYVNPLSSKDIAEKSINSLIVEIYVCDLFLQDISDVVILAGRKAPEYYHVLLMSV